jgi:MFS family permease
MDAQDEKLPRNVWVMTAASFFNDVSSDMVLNLVPLFLANALGARTSVVGLVEGVAEATASLLKLVSGALSDRFRSRKGPTVGGYATSAVAKPFLIFASSWAGVLVVRFADRVGKGVRTAPRDALLADSVAPEQRGAAFGVHRAGDSLGAATGLGLALLIVLLTQGTQLELLRETFQRVVLWSIVPGIAAVLVLAFGLREVRSKSPTKERMLLAPLKDASPAFRRFLFIIGLFTLGNSADAFIILRAQERGLSVAGVLAMLLTFNLVSVLVARPAGKLSDRIGRPRLIVSGWLVYALIYLGLALATEAWMVWVLFMAYGGYYGLVEGNARAFVADLAAAEGRGTAYGAYYATVGLILLPASLLAGILWQGIGAWPGFGPAAPFLFGCLMAVTATILFVWWLPGGAAELKTLR